LNADLKAGNIKIRKIKIHFLLRCWCFVLG
jgi:hypothetical protein